MFLNHEERISGEYQFDFLNETFGFSAVKQVNESCVYLKEGRCTIWARRPQTCREYDCRKDSNMVGVIPVSWYMKTRETGESK